MNPNQTKKLKFTIDECIDAHNRLEALNILCGYYQNGTQQTVTISQDDATQKVYILVDKKIIASGNDLNAALNKLVKTNEG